MKIGTDGVLLGAWIKLKESCRSVLDIGTGTGLIALMIAQRYSTVDIHAIDVDTAAAAEAHFNFKNSPWSNRLHVTATALEEFSSRTNNRFDHIVCNPPFYRKGYPINNQQRNLARNHAALPLKSLFQGMQQLLLPQGSCSLILPVEQAEEATELAGIHGLYLSRVTKVRGHATADFKRVLLAYSRTKKVTQSTTLTLELSRHERTLEHQALVDSFYLPKP